MDLRDRFRERSESQKQAPEPAIVEAPVTSPLPEAVSPIVVRERMKWALEVRDDDPVLAGERLIRVEHDTNLNLRQLARLDDTMSEAALQNLVHLARLPHEILMMVREGTLPHSKAQLIGRYLGNAPSELQIKAAQSIVKHNPNFAAVQWMSRIYQKAGEFTFPG